MFLQSTARLDVVHGKRSGQLAEKTFQNERARIGRRQRFICATHEPAFGGSPLVGCRVAHLPNGLLGEVRGSK